MLTLNRAPLVAAVVVLSLVAAPAALPSGPPAGPWCASVIRINTQFGTMKNNRYLPIGQLSKKAIVAVMEYALKNRAKLLAITPNEIRTAQIHELAFYTKLKANHYAPSTPLGPFTLADNQKLIAFQKVKCGIRFATS